MKMIAKLSILPCCLLTLSLVGCAPNMSADQYDAADVNTITRAEPGVVVSMRAVAVDSESGVGMIAGAVAGGVLGSALGGGDRMPVVGAVAGAVGGGYLGNKAEKAINHDTGMEYIVKLQDGDTVSLVQATDLHLAVGEHVLVIYGDKARIIPDTSIAIPATAPVATPTAPIMTPVVAAATTSVTK